jgi:hypothetical protein
MHAHRKQARSIDSNPTPIATQHLPSNAPTLN